MEQSDWPAVLLNGVTIHWVKVDINGEESLFKYLPLSLKEKTNIANKHIFEEDDTVRRGLIIVDECKLMLSKAYGTSFNPDDLSGVVLSKIYDAILRSMNDRNIAIRDFYNENRTALIEQNKSHSENSKLNVLINYGNIIKGCNMSIHDLADLDEMSVYALMCYMEEEAIRESNMYARSKQEGKK